MYDYGARMYMPDLGRWGVVDPLADVRPDMSPFRYSFNNPINATDPTGLLEGWIEEETDGQKSYTYNAKVNTVEEAKAAGYKNASAVYESATVSRGSTLGMGGYSYSLNANGSVTNNSDGSSINNTFATGAGTTINAPSGAFMSEWKMDRMEKWASSDNFAAKFTYGIANSAYVTAQIFDGGLMERSEWSNPLGGNYGNLDGTPNYQQADAFVNTASTALSSVRGLKAVTSAAPEGLTIAKLSASQFSSTFKGTAISRAAPATRGLLNRSLNKGIGVANGQMRSGTKALTITKGVGNLFNPDKKE